MQLSNMLSTSLNALLVFTNVMSSKCKNSKNILFVFFGITLLVSSIDHNIGQCYNKINNYTFMQLDLFNSGSDAAL